MIEKILVIAFVLVTIALVIFSWRSLLKPRSHGFFRFFAWEFIAALMLLNLREWFVDPFSWRQIISWVLLFASLIPLAFGVRTLMTRGKAAEQREEEPQLLAFEKTTRLVTTGIYGVIRHPMYSSLLLLAWGIFFKSTTWIAAALTALATLSLFLTAKADEAECQSFFGEEYRAYMKRTKRFIPFLF
jgi:protein-S-isoprenylcysteine O-methyltransferase Ste14